MNVKTTTTLTPSDITSRIQWILEALPDLKNFWIKGEISNLKHYQKGNQLYFNLCDDDSQLNCVVYATTLQRLKFTPKNGQLIHAKGQVKVYRKRGTINVQIATMQPLEQGPLSEYFNKVKQTLEQEGLFKQSRKQPIPQYQTHVGLITATNSAAQHDICQLLKKNAPHIRLSIFPSIMQGVNTAPSIKEALNQFKTINDIDSIIITRGGGSAEDLYGFNDESLVRLIATLNTPIITAIGHEKDTTLCDFVADHRCATPSAAAALLYQPYHQLKYQITYQLNTLKNTLSYYQQNQKNQLKQSLMQLKNTINTTITNKRKQLTTQLTHLEYQNPLKLLQNGYSHCQSLTGTPIHSITQVQKNDPITIHVKDGTINTIVTHKKRTKHA